MTAAYIILFDRVDIIDFHTVFNEFWQASEHGFQDVWIFGTDLSAVATDQE